MESEAPTLTPPPTRRKRGRGLLALGLALVLAGLGFLGYFAWEYFGTNVVSKHQQAEVRKKIVTDWGREIDGKYVGLLRVPRFGDDYEIPIIKSFSDKALSTGVGWYAKGAKPGGTGNFVLAGHRVTHGEPFADFPKLKAGDKIVVETRKVIYTYRLEDDGNDIRVPFTTKWPLWPVPDPEGTEDAKATKPTVTLVTCSELFRTKDRSVVRGVLIDTQSKKRIIDGGRTA